MSSLNPILVRRIHLANMIVFVDGITRTGKSMLGPILSSFNRVEIERLEETIEYIGALHKMRKIEEDAAIAMLRMQTDIYLYNSLIGRNVNFRLTDHSSVWNSGNSQRYVERLSQEEGQAVIKRNSDEKPIFQCQTHDQLANFGLYVAAFGDRLRIIEMIRHPIDLVDSWLRRGWGTRFGVDPLALTFCIDYKGQDLPYYALGFEEKYVNATPLGRVIRIIASLWDENQNTYTMLPSQQQEQVLFISFERFIQYPEPYIDSIAHFLGTSPSEYTPIVLKRERCPREYLSEIQAERWAKIKKQATIDEIAIMDRLIEEYETASTATFLS